MSKSLLDHLRHEVVDIIEWIDDAQHTLVWRFPRYHNQIKHGARLVVRPGQQAIFVHEGRLADVFEPGTHELTTRNLPVLATLLGWKHGFESPFKSEVYFVATRQVTGLKWGTPNPIMLRDEDFGPIRLRAFGTYNLKASEPRALLEELVGTEGAFEAEEIGTLMRSIITSAFADLVASSKIAALDLAASYSELSEALRRAVVERVDDEYGLDVPQLFIVNISLPEGVERALDTRSKMSVIGDMAEYQKFQLAQAMTKAAGSPAGGGAAEGMGLGMGFAMASQMMQGMGAAATPAGAPPPLPTVAPVWHVAEGEATEGPFTVSQLGRLMSEGRIAGTSLVWRAGLVGWTPLAGVPELAGLVTPPPLPPAAPG